MFLIAVILFRTLKSSKRHSYSCRTLDHYPKIFLSTHYRRIRVLHFDLAETPTCDILCLRGFISGTPVFKSSGLSDSHP